MISLPWVVRGRVVRGRGLGRRLGAPTYNLRLGTTNAPEESSNAPEGVFVGLTVVRRRIYPSVVFSGKRLTFGDCTSVLETHLLIKPLPLVSPKSITVVCLVKLRSNRKFKNTQALARQIQKDIGRAQRWFERT